MKLTKIMALLPALLIGAGAHADPEILTFAGECSLGLKGGAFQTVDSFHLEAKDGECPHKNMEFSVPREGGAIEYGIYVEFQRSEFGAGLRDKPYFGYYEKSDGSVSNHAKAFNVKQGTVLTFSQELKEGARLYCSGTIQ